MNLFLLLKIIVDEFVTFSEKEFIFFKCVETVPVSYFDTKESSFYHNEKVQWYDKNKELLIECGQHTKSHVRFLMEPRCAFMLNFVR